MGELPKSFKPLEESELMGHPAPISDEQRQQQERMHKQVITAALNELVKAGRIRLGDALDLLQKKPDGK